MIESESIKPISTIVLAGGRKNIRWHDITTFFTDMYRYHEHYLPSRSYKTIRPMPGTINGEYGKFPIILYLLNTLIKSPSVGKIIIIGPQSELEDALGQANFSTTRFKVIEQGDSFGENMMLAYNETKAKGHVLAVMGDSPLTTPRSIENFVNLSSKYLEYDNILPVVKAAVLEKYARFMPRPYLKLLPDGLKPASYCQPEDMDKRGRIGVRLTSLAMCNLQGMTADKINHLRSLRKVLRPAVQKMIRNDLGTNVLIQYRRGIPFSWVCKKFEQLYGKTIITVGLHDAGTAIDVDSSTDIRAVSRIFSYRRKKQLAESP